MAAREPAPGAPRRPSPADRIGVRVLEYRRRRDLKVSELARLVGVSPSLISQIERGQSRPSVATLFSLAEALGVSVDAFFGRENGPVETRPDPGPGHRHVVRRGKRTTIEIEGGVRWERLTPSALDSVEFLEIVYAPGTESSESLYRHPGMEMVLVLSGRFEIHIGFDHYQLGPGDSICFHSSMPHRYVNAGDEEARAVTVILRDEPGAEAVSAARPAEGGRAPRRH